MGNFSWINAFLVLYHGPILATWSLAKNSFPAELFSVICSILFSSFLFVVVVMVGWRVIHVMPNLVVNILKDFLVCLDFLKSREFKSSRRHSVITSHLTSSSWCASGCSTEHFGYRYLPVFQLHMQNSVQHFTADVLLYRFSSTRWHLVFRLLVLSSETPLRDILAGILVFMCSVNKVISLHILSSCNIQHKMISFK